VGRTTFYDYFTDRDDVIASLVEEELPRVIGELIGDVPPGLALPERLTALATGMIRFVAEDRVFGVILHHEVGRMGHDAQLRIRSAHADLSGEMASIYREGVETGLFAPMPHALAARLIHDCIMSAARVVIDGGATADEVTEAMSRFLLDGLGNHRVTLG
jgi:AcrR family transcriptional regulator